MKIISIFLTVLICANVSLAMTETDTVVPVSSNLDAAAIVRSVLPIKSDFAFRKDSLLCCYDHSFSFEQIMLPGTLLAAGSVITGVPGLHKNLDGFVRNWAQGYNPPRVYFDDYVQYVPLGSVVLLKGIGLKSEHDWRDIICLTGGSCLIGFTVSTAMKHLCLVGRPGNPDERTSFPSGHTTTAFLGAELLRREYGKEYPAVAVAGYTVATGIACMRIWNDRHWVSDLLGGAGVAILSVGLTYWLAPYLRF